MMTQIENVQPLKAPFPWFGGKSRVAGLVWERFGDVQNYVEPFFGSGAVLLGRPHAPHTETINDKDGFVANFWRAVQADPEAVARYTDNPVSENDLHARHSWLVNNAADLVARLEGDPDHHDAKIAGWWVWGLCCWIGSGWCSGAGPWIVDNNRLVDRRKLPHLGDAGRGVNRKLPHLGDAGRGVNRQLPHLGNAGRGVNRQLPHLGNAGMGVNSSAALIEWMQALSDRLQNVRVCCGDWKRVTGRSVTTAHGMTGVFLDPPYDGFEHLYLAESSISAAVCEWATEHGNDPKMRIALCGYENEHAMPEDWECVAWKANGGHTNQSCGKNNNTRERIWFSPGCLGNKDLF